MDYCCVSLCAVSFRLSYHLHLLAHLLKSARNFCGMWVSVNTILASHCLSKEGCEWVQLYIPCSCWCREQRRHDQKWDVAGAGLVAFHQVFTVRVAAYSNIFLGQLYITAMPDAVLGLKEDRKSEKWIKVYCKIAKSVWRHARSDSCPSIQGWVTTLRKY